MNQISQMFISKRPITRNTVKMVAEPYYGTALYSAVDKSCKVVAADPLSLIPPFAMMSWMQWFGVMKWAESPAADYRATSLKQAPGRVPERLSGESPDILGDPRATH